jgi:hypothetical protein
MLSGDGPAKMIPAALTVLAKSTFSLKKPYPGMIASTQWFFAISTI